MRFEPETLGKILGCLCCEVETTCIHPLGSSIVSITIIGIADVVIEIIARTVGFQHLNHRRIAECQITTITELTGGAGSGEE